jgi:hypothetical protein
MALRQNLFDQTTFKVVEINNMVALRSGHMLSQVVLPKNKFLGGSATYIENGEIVFLDVDGKLATLNKVGTTNGSDAITNAADVKPQLQPFLIFNEELMTGPYTDLKYFAEVFDADNVAYPRALALNVGDSFTTNNYVGTYGTDIKYATINGDGKLAIATALPTTAYRGPLFACVPGYLPDGTSQGVEFTVIALNVLFVAD